jgi:hypothetical protein
MDISAVLITFFIFGGLFWVTRPLVQALAERIRHRSEPAAVGHGEEVLEELRAMRRDMAELAERVDFTERVLAKQRDAARLPG